MKAGSIQKYFRKTGNANDLQSACNKENKACEATAAQSPRKDTKKQDVVCILEDDEDEKVRQSGGAPHQMLTEHMRVFQAAHVSPAVRKRQQAADEPAQQQVVQSQDTASKRQRKDSTANASSLQPCNQQHETSAVKTPAPKQQSSQASVPGSSHVGDMQVDQAAELQPMHAASSSQQQASSVPMERSASQPMAASQHNNACVTPQHACNNPRPGDTLTAPNSQQHGQTQSAAPSLIDVEAMIEEARAALCQELLLPTSSRKPLASLGQPGSQQEQEQGPNALPQAEVAALLEGQTCGLQQLVALLVQNGAAGDCTTAAAESGKDAQTLRETVLMLAGRKAYGIKDGTCEPELEGAPPADAYWFWELRDVKKLQAAAPAAAASKAETAAAASAATNNRKLTELYRKRRKELHELLLAACHLRELLAKDISTPAAGDGATGNGSPRKKVSKAQEKEREKVAKALHKAHDKLGKLHTVEQVEAALQAGIAALHEKDAHRLAQMSSKEQERQEAKVKREVDRAARAAEKAKEAEARAADREARAAEKAKEAAAKAEKVALREAKAAGFGNKKELGKCQGIMASFFRMGTAKTPAGKADANRPAGGTSTSPPATSSDAQLQTPAGQRVPGHSTATTPHGTATQLQSGAMKACGPCHEADLLAMKASQLHAQLEEVIDRQVHQAACHPGLDVLGNELRDWCRAVRQQAWRHRREKGVPPSWQQRGLVASTSTAPQQPLSFHAQCVALFGEDYQPAGVRLLRRKLLAFADSVRPAFYGNWPNSRSAVVRGRRPFEQDPRLDYEVQSDQEWEEEPEGTDIEAGSDEEVSDVRGGGDDDDEEEEGVGFVVDDGYLSGDEGVQLEGADMEVDSGTVMASARSGALPAGSSDIAVLEHAVMRQLQSNTPLLLCSLPGVTTHPTSTLNPALLKVLAGSVLRPGVVLTPPQETDIYTAPPPPLAKEETGVTSQQPGTAAAAAAASSAGAAATPAMATGPASGAGRRPQPFPEQLQPLLERYLRQTKDRAVDKVVEGFLAYIGQGLLAAPVGSTGQMDSAMEAAAAGRTTITSAVCAELGLTLPLPHCSKKALKERIQMTGSYSKAHGGWVIHPVLATPTRPSGGSNKHKTPGSNKPHPFTLAGPSPVQPALPTNTPAGHATICPPSTGGATAGPLPTPLACTAATQLLAGTQAAAAAGGAPAGAPTPWPTPHTTIPAAGGAAPLTAVAAAMDKTLPNSVDPMGAYGYRYAPLPGAVGGGKHAHVSGSNTHGMSHHLQGTAAGLGTPVTPIPCPLSEADMPQQRGAGGILHVPTPATAAAAPQAPANTPATMATSSRAWEHMGSVQRQKEGSRFGQGIDMHQAAARMQQELGAAAGCDTRAAGISEGHAAAVEVQGDSDVQMVDGHTAGRSSSGTHVVAAAAGLAGAASSSLADDAMQLD